MRLFGIRDPRMELHADDSMILPLRTITAPTRARSNRLSDARFLARRNEVPVNEFVDILIHITINWHPLGVALNT
jgi:hypothetical protein